MAKRREETSQSFVGFDRPESNWFRMPNSWTDITAGINSIAELKIVEYILRHTWGYQEYGVKKHITIDEFVNGRRLQSGGRMDRGTGLSERAVYDGLRKAVEDGYVDEDVDASDRGRVKKSYSLKMRESPRVPAENGDPQDLQSGVQSLHPPLQSLHPGGAESAPRTEKDTLGRKSDISNIRKETPEEKDSGTTRVSRSSSSRGGEPEAIGDIVAKRAGRPRSVPQQDEAYQAIQAYIEDFRRELNDRAPLKSSTMRAYNLYQRSGLSLEGFIDRLYGARAIVKERTGSIRNYTDESSAGLPTKNKAAYFFAVLEDLLGFKDDRPPASNAGD